MTRSFTARSTARRGGAPAEPTFFQNQQAEAAALIAPPAVPAPLSVLPSSSGAAAAGEGEALDESGEMEEMYDEDFDDDDASQASPVKK